MRSFMYRLFEHDTKKNPLPLDELQQEEEESQDQAYCCVHCENLLVLKSHAIRVQEQHTHHFVNPQGILYEVACFRTAPGVIALGEPSFYWTWFVGYRWQTALCKTCKRHIGWKFLGEDDFFALIEQQLISCQEMVDRT